MIVKYRVVILFMGFDVEGVFKYVVSFKYVLVSIFCVFKGYIYILIIYWLLVDINRSIYIYDVYLNYNYKFLFV